MIRTYEVVLFEVVAEHVVRVDAADHDDAVAQAQHAVQEGRSARTPYAAPALHLRECVYLQDERRTVARRLLGLQLREPVELRPPVSEA